jgi:hypothetical protein
MEGLRRYETLGDASLLCMRAPIRKKKPPTEKALMSDGKSEIACPYVICVTTDILTTLRL